MSIFIKDQSLSTLFVYSIGHIKGFKSRVVLHCFREIPAKMGGGEGHSTLCKTVTELVDVWNDCSV